MNSNYSLKCLLECYKNKRYSSNENEKNLIIYAGYLYDLIYFKIDEQYQKDELQHLYDQLNVWCNDKYN